MSESLGCHLAEVFTSIASVSGNTVLLPGNAGGLAACDAVYKSPTSILHVHGNLGMWLLQIDASVRANFVPLLVRDSHFAP